MAKLWAGRFKKETDQAVNAFNASIGVDQRMYREEKRFSGLFRKIKSLRAA